MVHATGTFLLKFKTDETMNRNVSSSFIMNGSLMNPAKNLDISEICFNGKHIAMTHLCRMHTKIDGFAMSSLVQREEPYINWPCVYHLLFTSGVNTKIINEIIIRYQALIQQRTTYFI